MNEKHNPAISESDRLRHPLTPLESLDEIERIHCIKNGGISIEKYGADFKECEYSEAETEDGLVICGYPVVEVEIGQPEEHATLEVIDLSNNDMHKFYDGYYRLAGHMSDDGDLIPTASNFGVIMRSQDGKPMEFFELIPGQPIKVGRNPGSKGEEWLPDSVSRDHLSIFIDPDGKLVVENHEPTNNTIIARPKGVHPGGEDQSSYIEQEIYLPNKPRKLTSPLKYYESQAGIDSNTGRHINARPLDRR